MAQVDRSFTSDVYVFSIGGDILPTLVDATVTIEVDEKENRAAKDIGQYLVAGIAKSTIRAKVAVENTNTLAYVAGTRVSVNVVMKNGGTSYTGAGLVNPVTHDFSENGAQTADVTIKCGNLIIT